MNTFWLVLLAIAPGFVLNAQTNRPAPAPEPDATASTHQPAPMRITQIESRTGEFVLSSNVFIFRENVRANNPDGTLTCDLLTAKMPRLTNGSLKQGVAEGNVIIDFLDQEGQTNHATADKAIYTYSVESGVTNAFVELIGHAMISNAQGSQQGDSIIWDRIRRTGRVINPVTNIRDTGTNGMNLFEEAGAPKANKPKPVESPQ